MAYITLLPDQKTKGGGLQSIEGDFLTVLEARNSKLKCWHRRFSSEACGGVFASSPFCACCVLGVLVL